MQFRYKRLSPRAERKEGPSTLTWSKESLLPCLLLVSYCPVRLANMALKALVSPSGANTLTLPGVEPFEGAGGGLPVGIAGLLAPPPTGGAALGAGGFAGTGLVDAPGMAGLASTGGTGVVLRLVLAEVLGDPPFNSGLEAGLGGAGFEGLGGGAALGLATSSR